MKILFSLALLLPTLLFAQEVLPPQPMPQAPLMVNPPVRRQLLPNQSGQAEVLTDNFLLTLVLKEKDAVVSDVAIVVTTGTFNVGVQGQPGSLSGQVRLNSDGTVRVSYMMVTAATKPVEPGGAQYGPTTAQSEVRLQPGADPETIFRSGTQSAVMSVIKLPMGKAK